MPRGKQETKKTEEKIEKKTRSGKTAAKTTTKASVRKTTKVEKTAAKTGTKAAKPAAKKAVTKNTKTTAAKAVTKNAKTAVTKAAVRRPAVKGAMKALETITMAQFKKGVAECNNEELYASLLMLTKDASAGIKKITGKKKVYYISAEFLIGRLLANNLINLGMYDELKEGLASLGKDMNAIEEVETEPSLGNGGLGRLAACFIDSIAALKLPGDGIGLNYHYGLFKQVFRRKKQCAEKNDWIEERSWLNKTDVVFPVSFGKQKVKARLYDIDVPGYNGGKNTLHLFDLEGVDEKLVTKGIDFDKKAITKNLTLFLYPDDSDDAGRILRVYQQYFMVSAGAQLILKEMKDNGRDLHKLDKHVVIQINDTHPSMVIPELIRLLTEQEGFTMNEAVRVVSKSCAYTNHTILAEALEKWPLEFLKTAVPQLVPIILELNERVKKKYPKNPAVWILDDTDRVHMAKMDMHYGISVNGVAALHTEILKKEELNDFYKIYPEKFNNKTNGITFRRWLLSCNPELAGFISLLIGDGYKTDPEKELKKLLNYADNDMALKALEFIKHMKKEQLAAYIKEKEGVVLDTESIFDIQIKRMHEYKRQQMNALYIIHRYLEIKSGKIPSRPVTFLFGAKAAPAYVVAREIIHLLLCLQEIVNKDPVASRYMKIVFVENYNVSYAEKLIPACDISEQISLASQEASGTGNMKFMLNGAVTLGTDDGANVEIHDLVGDDAIFIFGKKSDEVLKLRENWNKNYHPEKLAKDPVIREALDFLQSPELLKVGDKKVLKHLYDDITGKDWFMALLDLKAYIKAKDQALEAYENRRAWQKMMLKNIAMSGFFSSDRTIAEYNRDIWKV